MFAHLHAHSWYSFLSGTLSIERLVALAAAGGCEALALTDTNNVTGATEFLTRARDADLRPILGAEVRTADEKAVLLARNWDGYQSICEIVTCLSNDYPAARILTDGEEPTRGAIEDEERPNRVELRSVLPDLLTGDVIVLTQDRRLLRDLRGSRPAGTLFAELTRAQEGRWPALLRDAEELDIPLVATNDVHFGEPGGHRLHGILRAISTNTTMGTLDPGQLASEASHFCSEADFSAWFHAIPSALSNRERIVEACDIRLDFTSSKFASFSGQDMPRKLDLLRTLAWQGFEARYPHPTPAHRQRIEKEFRIIAELGFVDYFLVAWDVVRYARHRNYPYVGRGSGANSMVAYCLEITNVDPIALDLFFERFLNPERKSPPDFDIDFSWRNRDDVIEYVLEKYDRANTAMIGTISTYSPRGALREVGKALGFGEAEIKEFTAMMPSYGSLRDLDDAHSPFHRHTGVALSSPYGRDWVRVARRILEFPNHYGIHSGGVILAPERMTRYTATQVAPKGVRITQQDMYSMEDWHLEKLDILSTRGLGTFEDTMRAVEIRTGQRPPILDYRVAMDDARTRAIMREGRTIGCFYVESPAMIQLLRKLRTDTFEMLTAASSIIRPGVAQSGMMQAFIERYHDPAKIRPPHPAMAELLRTTFGVMVYQEDVIKVAHFIGKLSLGEADLLRRAMSGKMRSRDAMMKLQERFFSGCLGQGIAADVAAEIWRQMESFAGYSFCKAHSASYAVLSFQEAYLKAYWPALFLCSVLNNQGGYYRPDVYIQEAKRLGIRMLLPDVNASMDLCECPDESTIQLGWLHVKGLSVRSAASIIAVRERDGRYRGVHDFLTRSGVTYEDASILVRCGACDGFGEKRSAMLMKAKMTLKAGRAPAGEELPLPFPDFAEELAHLRSYSPEQVTAIELETFSYAVSTHVLSHFAAQLEGTVRAVDLAKHVGRRVSVGGWMIAAKMARTKKGERMMFMNLDDSTGNVDIVVFPKCYERFGHLLRGTGPFKVRGRIASEYGVVSVVAEDIEVLEAG
ncbi:MAG: DNA polymerase III subunit alpha [Ignavibacteria bacterium]|nr:DNA polymerase III subunit alpha [Ignavibacteria bacterium]